MRDETLFKLTKKFNSTVPPTEQPSNPCNPSPCGANAICKERNGAGSCSCIPDYFGDPYSGCRPECIQDSECDRTRACVNNKCVDPCIGVCGGELSILITIYLCQVWSNCYLNTILCCATFWTIDIRIIHNHDKHLSLILWSEFPVLKYTEI